MPLDNIQRLTPEPWRDDCLRFCRDNLPGISFSCGLFQTSVTPLDSAFLPVSEKSHRGVVRSSRSFQKNHCDSADPYRSNNRHIKQPPMSESIASAISVIPIMRVHPIEKNQVIALSLPVTRNTCGVVPWVRHVAN